MEKLDKGEIDASTASAQAKLVAQCNNLLNYELKRAVVINAIESNNAKENIREIENPIEVIQNLRGVRYEWIDNDKTSIGVIAQEIEKVLPEVVELNKDGLKSVSYGNIIGVIIEALKNQETRINNLENNKI
jgi:MinD-like ATPase involved in chromosome partitioning or flagellar assembly